MEPRASAFQIRLADTVIQIEPLYSYLQEYCKDYRRGSTGVYCPHGAFRHCI